MRALFTLFRPEFEGFARQVIADQSRFRDGGWLPADLRAMQLERLTETVRYARRHSPFYGERLDAWDLAPASILTQAQVEQLPFTTKDDLREHLFDVPSRPLHEAWVFYETTGTTGRATPCPRDERDSIVNNTALTLAYRDIFDQHGSDHVVAVMGPTELHSTGDTFGDVLRNLGHTVVKMWPHSPVVGLRRALTLLDELPITAMVCTPGMAIALARECRNRALDPRSFGLRVIFALGELASPAMLDRLGEAWGATVYNCMYASQEASILAACEADGLLHTVPLNNYYEIIDPLTGRSVDPVAGLREGELVVTSLYQGSKPLVRYRTGDMVRLHGVEGSLRPDEVLRPIGRVRDVVHLAGRPCYAFDLEQTLFGQAHGALDYRLVIDREDGNDTVTVHLEPVSERLAAQIDVAGVAEAMRQTFGVRCNVVLGAMDAITSTGAMVSWKAARIDDRRVRVVEPEREAALAIAAARSGT